MFKLVSAYQPDLSLEWHYNEAHHGKGPMDGIGGTIKNDMVFRQVKSGKIIINSAEDFYNAANQFCPSKTTLFQPAGEIMSEPDDIEKAPIIPTTLKIHKFIRERPSASGETKMNFYFLSNSNTPFYTKLYSCKKKCGHVDRDFNCLASFRSSCALCLGKYMDDDKTEDWLRCPLCQQWYHEGCFEQ